jgi:drug/metabolite transporter (DMT)-like permease
MQNVAYYLITMLIWGSTWLAIKFQLGVVSPELSIAYRFVLAAIFLFVFSIARRLPLRFNWRQHFYIALQGLLLFSFNYFMVYLAEEHLVSGLVAILFSTIIIANVIFGTVFLKAPVRTRVVVGAFVGILGLILIFAPELNSFNLSSEGILGVILVIASVISASLGNIISARNQRSGLPVIQTNAFGMAYGAALMFALAIFNGAQLTFDPSTSYILSLLYLALFGSVIAFGTYLTLLGRIGPDRAAYVTVLFPVIALALSTLFEGITWSGAQLGGVALVLIGNVIVLTKIGIRRNQTHSTQNGNNPDSTVLQKQTEPR